MRANGEDFWAADISAQHGGDMFAHISARRIRTCTAGYADSTLGEGYFHFVGFVLAAFDPGCELITLAKRIQDRALSVIAFAALQTLAAYESAHQTLVKHDSNSLGT